LIGVAEPVEAAAIPDMTGEGSIALPQYVKRAPIVRRLTELEPASKDDKNTLLGNRFLCRGAGALFVGSSGVGKSTAVIQMGICWAVGRVCFGIRPRSPLKILYVQAENDEGDLCEMRDGVLEHLELTDKEQKTLEENFICVFESSRTSTEFIMQIELLLEEQSPDLLILDPALSYIGGDANEQQTVGGFLRNLLNPLLQKYNCGVLIVHHTNKPNAKRDDIKKVANDFAYAGTGSAEWANWARAVLVLKAKNDDGVRELRIGKRFRLGWKDAAGKPCPSRLLRQNAEGCGLYYTEVPAEEASMMSQSVSPFLKVLRSDVLPDPGEDVQKDILVARISGRKLCGRDRALKEVIPMMIDEGYLEEKEVARPRKRPAIYLVRTNKMPGIIKMEPLA
jgi:hypothetical protein